MNFFRKKDQIFASFEAAEFSGDPEIIKNNLLGLMPVFEGAEVRLNMPDIADISLSVLSILVSFSELLKKQGAHLTLVAHSDVVKGLQKMNFGHHFDSLQVGVKGDVG